METQNLKPLVSVNYLRFACYARRLKTFTHNHTVSLTGTVGTKDSSHSHEFSIKRNNDNGTKNSGPVTNYVSDESRSGWDTDTKKLTTSDGGTHTHTLTVSGETVGTYTGTVSTSQHTLSHSHTFSGGDATTRPKTVIGYWIIKT